MKKITLITIIMGVFLVANAQIDENKVLDTDLVPRNELILTPEITEMLDTSIFSRMKNWPDRELSNYGIKNRSQLNGLQLGKPIPRYVLDNKNLIFLNTWTILVMSDGASLFFVTVRLMENGQYKWAGSGSGSAGFVEILHNYEYKDLIIGILDEYPTNYYIIRKDNKDIFVKVYDYETREYFSGEYSLPDIINLIKE